MRLLKAESVDVFEFEEFYDQNLPPYAILSHTWSKTPADEVLYLDVMQGTSNDKPAYNKVRAALLQAKEDKYKYCWVDTCCIDKSSSAELSEAINSMYRWYRAAGKCYAYLEDVSARHVTSTASVENQTQELQKSRWFGRGWTLQELLAPPNFHFYLKEWTDLPWNSKGKHGHILGNKVSLSSAVSRVTGIQEDILNGERDVSSASIAQRMSWASHRETSRLEDEAYCLMGLFDVNMPMLYGEGNKAFIRLQEEIIKHSQDESIFAWQTPPNSIFRGVHGLLADTPNWFANSGGYVSYQITQHLEDDGASLLHNTIDSTWTMTNRGLSLRLPLQSIGNHTIAVLGCQDPRVVGFIGIRLKRIDDQYARIDCDHLERVYESGTATQLFIPQTIVEWSPSFEPFRIATRIGKIVAASGRHWSSAQYSDYVVKDAIFRGDETRSRPLTESHWIDLPSTKRSKLVLKFAAFLIQSVHYHNQFVLLLTFHKTLDPFPEPARLLFHAVETPFGSDLGLRSPHDITTPHWQEANKQWMQLEGGLVRAVSLNAVPRKVPGGTCFEIDIAVHTNMSLQSYQGPSNRPIDTVLNETKSSPKLKAVFGKLRTRGVEG